MWLFYALLTALTLGIGQIFVKKGLKDISPLFNTALATVMGFFIFIPFALLGGVQFDQVFLIAPVALLIAVLFLVYYYALNHGQISLTGTVIGTYPIVTIILSLLFIHEAPSLYQKLAIGLVLLGTTLVALPNKLEKVHFGKWFWWALAAVFTIGIADFLIKVLINEYDVFTYLFTYGFCSMLVTGTLCLLDKKGRVLPKFSWKYYLPTLIGVGLIEFSFFIFHLALVDGYISLVSPISGIYVAITAILAWIILKERLSKIQIFGIALSTIGVVLIGIA
jgi:uncharacterized membrane protein